MKSDIKSQMSAENPNAVLSDLESKHFSLFDKVKALGIHFASHETDLCIPVNEQTKALIAEYEFKSNVTVFTNQVEGGLWYDIPFAYSPAWKSKAV